MVKVCGERDGVTIIGVLTEAGRIIVLRTQDPMNCLGFIEFLKYALNEVTGKLVAFADHHRMHQTLLVVEFVKDNEERLALEFTPCYAPECNPIEWVWAWVKKLLAMRCLGSVGALLEFWGKGVDAGGVAGVAGRVQGRECDWKVSAKNECMSRYVKKWRFMTRKTVVMVVSLVALTTVTVLAQSQTARWQKLLNNQMLSNVDAGAVNNGAATARAGETQTGMGDLGGLAAAAAGSSVSKLSLCADRSFVLTLEDSASVQGMTPVSSASKVTGSWAISAATQTDAKIKLTPRSAGDASILKNAQLQNFTVSFTGDRTFVNKTRWYRMPAAVCKK